jgi:radical SAM superfamily enzyme YgiQ (UPF0313 family)
MEMRVFFLNIPYFDRYSRESRSPGVAPSGTLYYPIYLSLAAGLVRKHGFSIDFLDAPAEGCGQEETEQRILRFAPDLIVSSTVTPSVTHDIKVMESLARSSGAMTMLVGTHPTARPEETLRMSPSLDFVAVGEYDYTVLDLVQHLDKSRDRPTLKDVPGLAFRSGDEIIRNAPRPWCEDLDSIPWASLIYRDFLKVENYSYGAQLHPEVTIVSARGCPYQCTYCVFPQTITGHRFRTRSVKDIVDEMEFIHTTWPHVKEIMFEDDTLTVDKARIRDLCDEILRRGLRITWSGNARADFDDIGLLKLMKKAGCRLFCVGFESADQNILNQMCKGGATVERQGRFVRACQQAGILIHGCFLFGGRNETAETMRKTLDFAKGLPLDTAQFFPIMAYPGTRAYDEAQADSSLATEDYDQWLTANGYYVSRVTRSGLDAKEITAFADTALREFYLRPSYITAKGWQFLTQPRERSRMLQGFRFFLKKLTTRESGS